MHMREGIRYHIQAPGKVYVSVCTLYMVVASVVVPMSLTHEEFNK